MAKSPEEEWQDLCDEHEAARNAVFKTMAPVIRKQGAVARNESRDNPSDEELDAMFRANEQWGDVKRRMDEFIEKCFGNRKKR